MAVPERRRDRLRSCDLESVAEAVDAFGEDNGLLMCRITPKKIHQYPSTPSGWCGAISRFAPCFTVPEGYHALVQRGGKDADYRGVSATWPAGLHWGLPWLRVKYLVTKQSVVYHCDVKHCITRDNVPVVVRATVVLRVRGDFDEGEDTDLVRQFAHGMGVRGLEIQLANAVEEGIRVMARATLHQAAYALTSGGGVIRRRTPPAPPLSPPPEPTPTGQTGKEAAAAATGRLDPSKIKRNQVAPSPNPSTANTTAIFSSSPQAAPFVAGTVGAVGGGHAAAATAGTVAASPASVIVDNAAYTQPTPLPIIQRGLRASRIVPAEVADALKSSLSAGEGVVSSKRSAASSAIAAVLNNPARVHPEREDDLQGETENRDDRQGSTENRSCEGRLSGGVGVGVGVGVGGVLETPVRSRPAPAATNLDLSPRSSISGSGSLPKLGLEVAQPLPVPGIPAAAASPDGGLIGLPGIEGGRGSGDAGQEERISGCHEGNAAARNERGGSGSSPGECGAGDTSGDPPGEKKPASTNGSEGGTSVSVTETEESGAAVAAAATAAAATRLEQNISLGRQNAAQLRDRLNRTLSPQGVEITTVMIRSAELPAHIAEQMSGATLYASLNEEQRAVKKSEVQSVKHEEEVFGLRQQYEIERALTLREGDGEVVKAGLRLQRLRAQANAAVGTISASASTIELRVASETEREVSRSWLREAAEHSLGTCSSEKAAGILEAEADAFRTRRESEAGLKVAHNSASSKSLVNASEEIGAQMLRAVRGHVTENKRLEVLNSLADNDLTLVTDSPLVTAVGASSVKARQKSDGITAMLLGEAGFKSQIFEASTRPGATGLPSSSSLAARRGRLELEAQLAFVAGKGGGTVPGTAFSARKFAVRLNPRFSSPRKHCSSGKEYCDCRNSGSIGGGGIATRESSSFSSGVRTKNTGVSWKGKKRGDGEDVRRAGRGERGAAAAAAADCELCIVRDGLPYALVCSV